MLAVSIMALGLIVMIGWHARLPMLVQLHPDFVPMQYNTALCFLCAGAALLAISLKKRRLALPLAGLVTLVGLLTLAQYTFATDFGIDQLWFHSYIFTQTSHAGRMSPVGALAFLMSGLALIAAGVFHGRKQGPLVTGLLSSVVIALGSMALFGYITGLAGMFGWGGFTRMALHTASGFMALGSGLFVIAWQEEFATTNRSPRWLPVFTGLIALSATLVFWYALAAHERAERERTIQANATIVKDEIVARLESRILSLGRMAERWEYSGRPKREVWEADATAYIEDYPGYQAIAWVDPELQVQWAVPLARNPVMMGMILARQERRQLALEMATTARGKPAIRSVRLFQGGVGIMASVPIYHQGRFEGFILGVIRLREFFDVTLGKHLAAGYAIALAENGRNLYERPGGAVSSRKDWMVEVPIEILGENWSARVWPEGELHAEQHSYFTRAVLSLGGLASGLLGLSVYLAQGAIARSQQAAASNRELQREIAERGRAEQDLRESRARLEFALDAAQIGDWDLDLTNDTSRRSLRYDQAFGYQEPIPDWGYARFLQHVHPEDRAGVDHQFRQALAESRDVGFECRVVWLDGSIHWIEVHGRIYGTVGGKPTRVLGIIIDVTDRKRAEAELAREQARFRFIFESMPVGAALARQYPDGRFERIINDAHLRICGLTREQDQIPGIYRKITHPEDAVRKDELTNRLDDGALGTLSMEKRYVRLDGEVVWVVYFLHRRHYADGGFDRLTTVVDITGIKQAEESLRASRALYHSLVGQMPAGIFRKDAAGRFVFVNPSYCQLKHMEADQILGRTASEIAAREAWNPKAMWREDFATQGQIHHERIMQTGQQIELEEAYTGADGQPQHLQIIKSAVFGPDQKIIGSQGVVFDITGLRRTEAGLREAHKQLLETSRQAGMAEVASSVLHNIGNVLNSVNVSANLVTGAFRESKIVNLLKVVALLGEHESDLAVFLSEDPKGKQLPDYLARLANYLVGERAAALEELSGLQKNIEHIKVIVAMQQSYAKAPGLTETLHLRDLVEDALRITASALTRDEVRVVREYADVPAVTIEKHKVLQILVNLIQNAEQACEESDRADKRMTVRVANGGGRVSISVTDNGIGISPENLTRIFSHGYTTRKDGHGFGLHGAALAAKEMRGSLNVCSDGPGQGATFTLNLPCEKEGYEAVQTPKIHG